MRLYSKKPAVTVRISWLFVFCWLAIALDLIEEAVARQISHLI
jgi:hypothetical protein